MVKVKMESPMYSRQETAVIYLQALQNRLGQKVEMHGL